VFCISSGIILNQKINKLMKNVFFFLLLLSASISAFAQEDEEKKDGPHNVSIGVNSGIVFNSNAYRLAANQDFTYYGINPHFNYGIDFGIKWSNKIRTRFEFKYIKMSYGMNWPVQYDYKKTETILYNFAFNFQFDYLVYDKNKFQIFISPGIISEIVKRRDFKTTNKYDKVIYKSILPWTSQEYRDQMLGGSLTVLAKYNFNNRLGITLNPGYSFFVGNFIRENNKLYSRFSATIGVEYSFW
jgi:hypothetical protein